MPSLSDFQYGGNASAVEGILGVLKEKLETVSAALLDTSKVETACNQNWTGVSKERFLENVKSDCSEVNVVIENLFGVLTEEVNNVMSAMQEHDLNMFRS